MRGAARRSWNRLLPGTAFGAFGEGYLRFSVANSIENLNTALQRIEGWAGKNLR